MISRGISGEVEIIYGARWAQESRHAVLDIDTGSKYHSAQELDRLRQNLVSVGLRPIIYQSSESGGWHVYLFFDCWHSCDELQQTLKTWLQANDYEVQNGVLEVFPGSNGLRLPLQSGFAWLDDCSYKVKISRENLTAHEALEMFVNDAQTFSCDWTKAKKRIEQSLTPIDRTTSDDAQEHQERLCTEGFDGLFNYRLIPEKYQDGRKYWKYGLSASGQRHDAILAIEHYLWHGDESAGVPAMPGDWNDDTRYRVFSKLGGQDRI